MRTQAEWVLAVVEKTISPQRSFSGFSVWSFQMIFISRWSLPKDLYGFVDVQVFFSKRFYRMLFGNEPKRWTIWNFGLMKRHHQRDSSQSVRDIIISSWFHGNPFNRCQDISPEKQKCQPHGGNKKKVRGSPKSVGCILRETSLSVQEY